MLFRARMRSGHRVLWHTVFARGPILVLADTIQENSHGKSVCFAGREHPH